MPDETPRITDEERATFFHGHEPRECGEHRTVGAHRAWCLDCGEWCYPDDGCAHCKIPQLEAEGARLRGVVADLETRIDRTRDLLDETPRITDDQLCERAKAARSSLYDEMDGWPFDNTGDAIMAGYERGFRDAEDRLRAALAEAEGIRALTAQRDAALALHHAGHDDVADRLGIDPYPGDVCVECGSTFPCSTVAALAGGGQ